MLILQIICNALGLLLLLNALTLFLSGFSFLRIGMRQDPPRSQFEKLPRVTLQLPIYNEEFVAGRLLDAVGKLDYPRDCLEIHILDDSDDHTCQIIDEKAGQLRQNGWSVSIFRRPERRNYKAGALAETLDSVKGEYLSVLDADFIPPSDYLKKTVPYLQDRPELAFVQTRWTYLNELQNAVTRLQALFLDMHFVIQKPVEQDAGLFLNYNGTGAVWRKEAVVACGGWALEALSEDMDISYRAQLQGWKAHYLPQVAVPGELPARIITFARQQERWAFGAIQFLRKYWREILHAPVSAKNRLHVWFVPSAYVMSVISIVMLVLLTPLAAAGYQPVLPAAGFFALLMAQAGLATLAQAQLHADWRQRMQALPYLLWVTVGLAPRLCRGVLKGMFKLPYRFDRTPKEGNAPEATQKRMRPSDFGDEKWMAWIEYLVVLIAAAGCFFSIIQAAWLLLGVFMVSGICIFGVNRAVANDVK